MSARLVVVLLPALVALGCASAHDGGDDVDAPTGVSQSALTSTLTGTMVANHVSQPSVYRLQSGKVLAFGNRATAIAELYDASTNSWTATGSMITARDGHASTMLADGRVMAVGGMANPNNLRLASAEIYDPATGAWSAAGATSIARIRHTATTLADGRILVSGGLDSSGSSIANADIFDPATATWTPAAPLPRPVNMHSATRLADGRVLVVGGLSGTLLMSTAYLYSPTTNTWTATGSTTAVRCRHEAVALADGRVLLAGGYGPSFEFTPTSEIYDPTTGSFSSAGSMSSGRAYPFSGRLANGDVLFGGGTSAGGDSSVLERYRPGVGWSVAGNLAIPRQQAGTALLAGGQLLVVAGWASIGTAGNSAERVDDAAIACVPTTCAAQGKNCGSISDGCGGTLTCGSCQSGQACTANVCSVASACAHNTCTAGGKLTSTCSSCASTVCSRDSYCCAYSWDSICVSEARSWCSVSCQ